jgi:hypothetical protein
MDSIAMPERPPYFAASRFGCLSVERPILAKQAIWL